MNSSGKITVLLSLSLGFTTIGTIAQPSSTGSAKSETVVRKQVVLSDDDKAKIEINATLNKITSAFVNQDLDTISKFISDDIISVNELTHQTFKGKDAVIANLVNQFKVYSPHGRKPLISFDIVKPEIVVSGKKAVAKYKAFAQIGGHRSFELYSEITEKFLYEEGIWKSYEYICHWTEEKGKELESGQINPSSYLKLEAGVKTLLVSLHGIKELGNDIKRARRGLSEYTKEATKKKLVVVDSGNEVGPIILESTDPKDMYLPARMSHLRIYLKELDTLIQLMKADVDSLASGALTLIVRKDIKKEMDLLMSQWTSKVNSASQNCKKLDEVTAKHVEDNAKLAEVASLLKSDLDELRILQKKMVLIFRKPIRSIR